MTLEVSCCCCCCCCNVVVVVFQLLIEWGCDVHVKGPKEQTAFETILNDEFREELISE